MHVMKYEYFLFVVFSIGLAKLSFANERDRWDHHEEIVRQYYNPYVSVRLSQNNEYCIECDDKSLSFYAASPEQWTLSLTETSLDVIPSGEEGETNGTVTGGIFGANLYKFSKLQMEWEIHENTVTLQIRDILYNTRYGAIENAQNYPDGIIQVSVPVNANGYEDNPLFDKFQETMQSIKDPGDSTPVFSLDSYTWFKNFPTTATYSYYKSSYYENGETNPKGCATTVELPLEDKENFISRKQFKNTFGRLTSLENPLNISISSRNEPKCNVKTETGIKVLLI